jgi:proteasome lid subunit RPN8/RPN11
VSGTEPPGLSLTDAARAAIHAHGEDTYPHECCGALLGAADRRHVLEALPLPNSTEEGPRRRFLITPRDYMLSEREARSRGLDLVGFYHSHPDHPARPSEHDLAHAWPNLHYIILSVMAGRADAMRDWMLATDRSAFGEVALLASPAAPAETA